MDVGEPRYGRKPFDCTFTITSVLLALLVLGFHFRFAWADGLSGEWRGYIAVDSLPQAVEANVSNGMLSIVYGAPRDCELRAKFKRVQGHVLEFDRLSSSCSHIDAKAQFMLLQNWGEVLEYEIAGQANGLAQEVGYLTRR